MLTFDNSLVSRASQVIVLTMGQTAYFGPAGDSLAHFTSLGHEPKGMVNPADYLLEVCASSLLPEELRWRGINGIHVDQKRQDGQSAVMWCPGSCAKTPMSHIVGRGGTT